MSEKVPFLHLKFDSLTLEESLDKIEGYIKEGKPRKIFTPNVALLIWSLDDPFLKKVYQSTDILTVDGMAIYYALKILGTPVKESLSASLMFYPLLALSAKKGYKIYMVGAKQELLEKAVDNIRKQYKGIQIVGYHNGYFNMSHAEDVVNDIRSKKPDILLIGMSSPLKEQLVDKYMTAMNVPVSLGVGGMFDIAAGYAKFAPQWVRVLCIEWLYRLLQEPGRMWKRYFETNSRFLILFYRELLRKLLRV